MSTKQEILKLARAAGLSKPEVKVINFRGNTLWQVFAENTSRHTGLWGDVHPKVMFAAYGSLEAAQQELPGDAQRFIQMVKREALEE